MKELIISLLVYGSGKHTHAKLSYEFRILIVILGRNKDT